MNVLVGGVGQLYQGDLDLGRLAASRLAEDDLGPGVVVEDLHYGAVAVAQRLEELNPATLLLVGAEARGRAPGVVERRRIDTPRLDPSSVQDAVREAVTGYVTVDLVVEVAAGLGVLPPRTLAIEVEPDAVEPSDTLSPVACAALESALGAVRVEVRRVPLFELSDTVCHVLAERPLEPSPALDALTGILDGLGQLDETGVWGATFACRDRLRGAIGAGDTGGAVGGVDWALWWQLIEELDRHQQLEACS